MNIRFFFWTIYGGLLTALLLLAGCRVDTQRTGDAEYRHITDATPWSVHVISFDLARHDLSLQATVGRGVNGSETITEMLSLLPQTQGVPIAAVNGDYFEYLTEPRYRGTLQGMTIIRGELVGGPAGTAFWVDSHAKPRLGKVEGTVTLALPDGNTLPIGLNCSTSDYRSEVRATDVVLYTPAFGPSTSTEGGREYILEGIDSRAWLPLRPHAKLRARIREMRRTGNAPISSNTMVLSIARKADDRFPVLAVGDSFTIVTTLTPDLTGVTTAISGDPLLVKAGQVLPALNNTARAPRTAVGYAGTRCYLVVVDGRQPTLSVGMSHRELAELMQRLGCTDALNLDGGGSSTIWFNGRVMNLPSDRRLRPVGNALVLLRKKR